MPFWLLFPQSFFSHQNVDGISYECLICFYNSGLTKANQSAIIAMVYRATAKKGTSKRAMTCQESPWAVERGEAGRGEYIPEQPLESESE